MKNADIPLMCHYIKARKGMEIIKNQRETLGFSILS